MAKETDAKISKLRAFFKKVQPLNHPIYNHPAAKCDEYTKGIYFDMLCVMSMYDNDDTENQNRFIQRLMAGSGDTLTISEHIRRAMELSVEKMADIIKQIKNSKMPEIFYLDAVIISCANGTPSKKQVEFLAELGDALGMTKDNIEFVCELAVAVLEQNFDKLKAIPEKYDNIADTINAADCYVKTIIDSNIVSTSKDVHYYYLVKSKHKDFSKDYEFKNQDSVTLENIIINKRLKFTSVKKVKLIGCIFENISDRSISFEGVEQVEIIDCKFRNLKGYILSFANSTKTDLKISKSYFSDCHHCKIITNLNFGMFGNDEDGICIALNSCMFERIYGKSDRYSGLISEYNKVVANNCEYYNCQNESYLFCNGSYNGSYTDKNCKYINCCTVKN